MKVLILILVTPVTVLAQNVPSSQGAARDLEVLSPTGL